MSRPVQLPTDTILKVSTDTEERLWNQGGINASGVHEGCSQDMGQLILQQGCTGKKIHDYFTNLEQRRCCLLLASCKQRFRSVRLVRSDGRDSGIEEGAMMKTNTDTAETVPGLNAVEFQVFQQALKCAAFPVLGAPDPPSGASPSPSPSVFSKKKLLTPPSLHDSGLEEQEDVAMIPAETLCELLRRAFRLTPEKFRQYEEIVASQMEKKSAQKVLAEELVRQLVALENNNNTFYSPKTFCNKLGYDEWQKRERSHITDLLNKFWHFSLPQSSKTSQIVPLHDQYKSLMAKLIQYESPYRQQSELIAPAPTTPLSSASVCLLKEFGLRYGVGEQYRKIVYLEYLALNFDPTIWFIQHLTLTLSSIMEAMPSKRSCLIIVQKELSLLESSLSLLEAKSCTAVVKMKTLFASSKPLDGIESLIELLALILHVKSYLLMKPEESLGLKLSHVIQDVFPATYERHKLVALDELRQSKWRLELSPNLLNMMIGNIRDEVLDFKNNYQLAFIKYFNITVEAAQAFYKLLMADVTQLCSQHAKASNTMEIDLLMLSLGYRLNQLDHDWSIYITHQMQTWRDLFLTQAHHWSVVIKVHMQDFVVQAMSTDEFHNCDLSTAGVSPNTTQSQAFVRHRAISKPLTPSANSAFSSLSSAHSTPLTPSAIQQTIHPESKLAQQPPVQPHLATHQRRPVFPIEESPSLDPTFPMLSRRPSSDPVNISQSSILNGTYLGTMARSLGHYDDDFLTFTNVRRSSSLPDIHSQEKYIEMIDQTRIKVPECDDDGDNDARRHVARRPSIVSQEVSSYLSPDQVENNDESDDSGTLTDESGSQTEEFNFPPIEEVKSSTPIYSTDSQTVSDSLNGQTDTLVRPVVTNSKQVSPNKYTSDRDQGEHKSDTNTYQQGKGRELNTDYRFQSFTHDSLSLHGANRFNEPGRYSGLDRYGESGRYSESGRYGGSDRYSGPDSFTDSLLSNMSFPHIGVTDHSNMVLPVSSSAIDVVVILQRIVGFGKTLCRMLVPAKEEADSSDSSLQNSGKRQDFSTQVQYKYCQKLYESFLSAICNTIRLHVDNMLSMDLCGTSNKTANRLAGPRLVEYLQTQQHSGQIWGCRHDVTGTASCFAYLNKQTPLLCDRHEAITRDMCTRINNVSAMLGCLDWYHRNLGNTLGIISDLSVRQHNFQMSINSIEMMRNEFIMLENYGYDPEKDRSEVMETASQLCPSLKSGSDGNILVTSPIDSDKEHIMAIVRAQCRIMAYRINLFVCDALPVLLTLTSPSAPLDAGLKPITAFLSVYISALKNWLYESSYRRVLECLWIFIVQDFELELNRLEKSETETQQTGQQLLQAMSHLLKFMNNQEGNLRKELLLSQAEDVSFKLSLYAMPISQLIAIHRGLVKESAGSEVSSTNTLYQTVIMVRLKLKQDLQKMRKCFSGDQLIRWIMKNQDCNLDLLLHFHPDMVDNHITRETAHHIAQRFLDWGLIADIEGDQTRRGDSPTSMLSYEFPDMSILTQMSGDRPFSRFSDDSPQATPRATPRPSLRTSLRALSSMSGVKSMTPATRVGERSQSSQFLRSLKVNEAGANQKRSLKQIVTVEMHDNGREASSDRDQGAIDELDQERWMTDATPTTYDLKTLSRQTTPSLPDTSTSSGQKTPIPETTHSDTQSPHTVQDVKHVQNSSIESESDDFEFPISQSNQDGANNANSSNNYDPYMRHGTPISMTSALSSESRTAYFFGSVDTFYYVCPQVGNEADFNHKNHELFQLVEQCFQRKITPEYIVKIIYSRRKRDSKGRDFIRRCPPHLIEKIKYEIYHEEVSTCVSS